MLIRLTDGIQDPFSLDRVDICRIQSRLQVSKQVISPLQQLLWGVLRIKAYCALALETPMFQPLLHFVMISCRDLVPERQLRVRRDMTGGADYLQVADEAAANIANTGVIDSGGHRPDAAGMVPVPAFFGGM